MGNYIVPAIIKEKIYIPRSPLISDLIDRIRKAFTDINPDYYRTKKAGHWTGHIKKYLVLWDHVHHREFGECVTIPRGGIKKFRIICNNNNIKYVFIDKRKTFPPITTLHNSVVLREDQMQLAKKCFAIQNCLIRSPTGSGKTEVALKVVEWILKDAGRTLIIVWETGLFNQWIQRIKMRFGISEKNIGQIQGDTKRIRPITVAMQQTLLRGHNSYFHSFGGVIADEVQRFGAATFHEIIEKFSSKYRIGFSADETRADRKHLLIYHSFGVVADEIEKSKLIQRKKIMDVKQRIIPTNFEYKRIIHGKEIAWKDMDASMRKDFYRDLFKQLLENEERNNLIWKFIEPCLQAKHTVIVCTRYVKTANYWDKRISQAGYSTGRMLGSKTKQHEFQNTVRGLNLNKIQVGIGTIAKVAQGHDIPRISRAFIINPISYKNEQLYEQINGRIRRIFPGKKDAVCYYFWDQILHSAMKSKIKRNYNDVEIWIDGQFLQVT